jgi:hypothetical protein
MPGVTYSLSSYGVTESLYYHIPGGGLLTADVRPCY